MKGMAYLGWHNLVSVGNQRKLNYAKASLSGMRAELQNYFRLEGNG